ncbi:MAG: hypothetical protein HQK88_14670 [Nitrospirae bacterium]|nr:hypothetical protein [Nitrospirota bacterium]MBF0533920.1 hypothetical protein [Nitrospirota bacterium]MBF0618042.1 hypothetical protein [Nitrospirota bacterium]
MYNLYDNHPDIVFYTVTTLMSVVIMTITIAAAVDYIKTNYLKIQRSPKSLLSKISRLIVKNSDN